MDTTTATTADDAIHQLRGYLLTDGDSVTIYAKGHIDKAIFCAAVEREFGYEVPPAAVQHIWMHYGPMGDMGGADYDYYQFLHTEGGRGRFKVTYWDKGILA